MAAEEHAEIQTKLIVSQPGDECELEADRVSRQVMRMTEPQRRHPDVSGGVDCEQTRPLPVSITAKGNAIQTKSAGSVAESVQARTELENLLDRSKGRGSRLPDIVLVNMATRFGVDSPRSPRPGRRGRRAG